MPTDRTENVSIIRESVPLTYIDPLAQSFIIERSCALTKVDLFFEEKDDNLPVKLEIRRVTNGIPNDLILPFSETTISAANINVSANSLIKTTAVFKKPIFVEPGEYALCLFSESLKTKIWVSQIGENDVSNGLAIQKQPYLGILFKSKNSTVWIPDQLLDLKFNLYRAKFNTGNTSSINFTLYDTTTYTKLPLDPLEVYPGSSIMKVYHPNHGFENGSSVIISRLNDTLNTSNVQYFGLHPANITGYNQVVSNVTPDSYTVNIDYPVNSNVKSITRFGDFLFAQSNFKFNEIFPTVPIRQNADSLVVQSIKCSDTNYVEDSSFTIINSDKDFKFETTKLLPSSLNRAILMNNTRAFTYKIEMLTNDLYTAPVIDLEKTGIIFINNKINNPTYETEHAVSSEIRTITTGNTTSFTRISATSGTVDLANTNARINAVSIAKGTTLRIFGANNAGNVRVLDVLNSGANVLVYGSIATEAANGLASSNVVILSGSKYIAEEAASGGSATSKYITRQLNFINPSSAFKIFLDVAKPTDTFIKIYYRLSLVGDTSALTEKEYTEITGITIKDSLGDEFYEIEKLVDGLENFDGMQLKIVFLSDNIAKIPRCRNLRIVAVV